MEILMSVFLLAAALAQGAAASPPQEATPICEIRANPERYLGKVITVTAHYSTDSSHYEYLTDSDCFKGTLDIGFSVPERDKSVEAFKQAQRELCVRRGTPYLCVLEGTVTVRGEIAQTTGAHLQPDLTYPIINLHSVTGWDFSGGR
jgi:hypothetical protein